MKIVSACKYVDIAVPQNNMNKLEAYKKYKFDVMFVGDDWYNTKKWKEYEKEFKENKASNFYFPYTKNTSSTKLNLIN